MSQQLISRSPDLQRLIDDGYEVEITQSNYLLIHNVPYVNSQKNISRATLGCPLRIEVDRTAVPDNHQAWFTGDMPCELDGSPINVAVGSADINVAPNVTFKWGFSSKPNPTPEYPAGYRNYYEKMVQYIGLISNPAWALDRSTARTFKLIESPEADSVFAYRDTASSRVQITEAMEKLKHQTIGIVGLGGTGSYVLDLIAKTPVREIHLFDRDEFLHHNAFRAPGAASLQDIHAIHRKVEYLAAIYSRMHTKIFPHPYNVDASNVEQITALKFVFLCLDKGGDRKSIVSTLRAASVPFIDVGMGVQLLDEDKSLGGILRVTTVTPQYGAHIDTRIPFGERTAQDDYSRNIQIADLNALNAALAVLKWKKLCGFYQDRVNEHHSTFTIDVNMLLNEEFVSAS